MPKNETVLSIISKVDSKAAQRKVALSNDDRNWIVLTLLADISSGFSESRLHRHMNSMLTRIKTQVKGQLMYWTIWDGDLWIGSTSDKEYADWYDEAGYRVVLVDNR